MKNYKTDICLECGGLKEIYALGLCNSCYQRLRLNNKLDSYKNNIAVRVKCINDYIIDGNIIYLTIINNKNNKKTYRFNVWHEYLVKEYNWGFDDKGYAVGNKYVNGKLKLIRMHNLLFNDIEGICDHEDRDKTNNLDNNFRKCSNQENRINNPKRKDNTSGFIGVYYNKLRNNWRSSIYIHGKNISLGSYADKDKAIIARLKAEIKYFDREFAPQRHLFEQYNLL